MTRNTVIKRSAYGWPYLLPEVAAPIGGGLLKIGHASTLAAASVGLAPYAILAIQSGIFLIGYVPAVLCYLCSRQERREAMGRLITTSADAIVSLQTSTPTNQGVSCAQRTGKPRLTALKGGSDRTPKQDAQQDA